MTERSYPRRLAQRVSELRSLEVRIARQYLQKKKAVPTGIQERLGTARKLVEELRAEGEREDVPRH